MGKYPKNLERILESMSRDQLIATWNKNDQSSQTEQIFDLISEVLTKRKYPVPTRTKFQIKSVKIPDSNASVKMVGPRKWEIVFPKDGYMRPGQFKFNNEKEIEAYLCGVFMADNESSEFKGGTITRRGKYMRIDEKGNPIFASGDPIVDLTTGKDGIIYISGKMHDLTLGHAAARRGGISSTDLKTDIADFRNYQPTYSVSDIAGFSLGERNGKVTTIASSNPEIWFYEEGTDNKMRFRTFRHNRALWKSLGCEIETWGGSDAHFRSAGIESYYGNAAIGCCTYLKYDYDSDTNDDFVDEYEIATAGFSLPDGVNSYCTANWRNMQKDGRVWDFCECVTNPE
jgi:hypothetical protein